MDSKKLDSIRNRLTPAPRTCPGKACEMCSGRGYWVHGHNGDEVRCSGPRTKDPTFSAQEVTALLAELD